VHRFLSRVHRGVYAPAVTILVSLGVAVSVPPVVRVRGRRALRRDGPQFLSWPSGACEGRAPFSGCLRRELLGRQVAQARMRPFPIVLDAPLFDLAARIGECGEDVFIQAFLAHARIEAFDMRVLNRACPVR
jgi:hypothetical protein